MKKGCIVAYAVKQQAGESDSDYQTRLKALEYIRYGKVVLLPDNFSYQEMLMRLPSFEALLVPPCFLKVY